MDDPNVAAFWITLFSPIAVFLLFYLQLPRRQLRPELRWLALLAIGGASGFFAGLLEGLEAVPFALLPGALHAFADAYLSAGLVEEAAKGFVVWYFAIRGRPGLTGKQLLMYGLVAGLGFGLLESYGYAYTFGTDEAVEANAGQIAFMRAFLTTPFHGLLTGVLAHALGRARGLKDGAIAWRGYLLVVLLHGSFDLPSMAQEAGLDLPLLGLLNPAAFLTTFGCFLAAWWRKRR